MMRAESPKITGSKSQSTCRNGQKSFNYVEHATGNHNKDALSERTAATIRGVCNGNNYASNLD